MSKNKVTLTIDKPTQCNIDCPLQYQGICFPIGRIIESELIPSWCPLEDCKEQKINIVDFTKKEEEYFIQECGFTEEELRFFNLRKNKTYIEIADIMKISVRTANNISKRVKKKIIRVI